MLRREFVWMGRIALAMMMLSPTLAFAQQAQTLQFDKSTQPEPKHTYELVIKDSPSHEILTLEDGACLVGRIYVYDAKGDIVFKLEEGQRFPAGC